MNTKADESLPKPSYSQTTSPEPAAKEGAVPAYAWSGDMAANGWPSTPPACEAATVASLLVKLDLR